MGIHIAPDSPYAATISSMEDTEEPAPQQQQQRPRDSDVPAAPPPPPQAAVRLVIPWVKVAAVLVLLLVCCVLGMVLCGMEFQLARLRQQRSSAKWNAAAAVTGHPKQQKQPPLEKNPFVQSARPLRAARTAPESSSDRRMINRTRERSSTAEFYWNQVLAWGLLDWQQQQHDSRRRRRRQQQ